MLQYHTLKGNQAISSKIWAVRIICFIRLSFWISFHTISLRIFIIFILWLLQVLLQGSFIIIDQTGHFFEIFLLFSFQILAVNCLNYELIIQVNLHFFRDLDCTIISAISFNQHVFFQMYVFVETHYHTHTNLKDHNHFLLGFLIFILHILIFSMILLLEIH